MAPLSIELPDEVLAFPIPVIVDGMDITKFVCPIPQINNNPDSHTPDSESDYGDLPDLVDSSEDEELPDLDDSSEDEELPGSHPESFKFVLFPRITR